jgi:hypothetical protein
MLFLVVRASKCFTSLHEDSFVFGFECSGHAWTRSQHSQALFYRIADPDQPVLWLDQMPVRSLSRGFNNHINLIRYEPFVIFPQRRDLAGHWGGSLDESGALRASLLASWRVARCLPLPSLHLLSCPLGKY